MSVDYQHKYFKYKNKYLALNNMVGGKNNSDINMTKPSRTKAQIIADPLKIHTYGDLLLRNELFFLGKLNDKLVDDNSDSVSIKSLVTLARKGIYSDDSQSGVTSIEKISKGWYQERQRAYLSITAPYKKSCIILKAAMKHGFVVVNRGGVVSPDGVDLKKLINKVHRSAYGIKDTTIECAGKQATVYWETIPVTQGKVSKDKEGLKGVEWESVTNIPTCLDGIGLHWHSWPSNNDKLRAWTQRNLVRMTIIDPVWNRQKLLPTIAKAVNGSLIQN